MATLANIFFLKPKFVISKSGILFCHVTNFLVLNRNIDYFVIAYFAE